MAVKESPKTFESHGREFATLNEAKRHDKLYTAREALQDAQKAYGNLLAESAKTADGVQFSFGDWHDYWYIVGGYFSPPDLAKVSFFCGAWAVRGENEESVEVKDESYHDRDGANRTTWTLINKLYWSKDAAERALIVARDEWLAERAAETDKLRATHAAKRIKD